jgi:putative DNA primase/helicase
MRFKAHTTHRTRRDCHLTSTPNKLNRTDKAMDKKPFRERVAEKLIEHLEQGTAPWQRPWEGGQPSSFMPLNPTTGKRYKGINAMFLMAQGYSDQRWMTYKQAESAGAQVRKGERGTSVQYWKFHEEAIRRDAAGQPVLDAPGKPATYSVELERPRVFFATVFNGEQIEGLPELQRAAVKWNPIERAEQILRASGATILHSSQPRAYYQPTSDRIHLPEKAQFPAPSGYYATALHELGHWTGHTSRLDRDLSHPFGSEGYAKEELRAEIASMILGDELGIGHDVTQHAAYVASWIKVLKDDPLEIFRASADAEKILSHVMSFELNLDQQISAEDALRAELQKAAAAVDRDEAHLVPRDHFLLLASAIPSVDRAYQWEVVVGSKSFGHSEMDDAMVAVQHTHRRLVNEALLSHVVPSGAGPVLSLPGTDVMRDYPDLANAYADLLAPQQAATMSPSGLPANDNMENSPEMTGSASKDSPPPLPQKATPFPAGRTYLSVPYKERNEAKALGAKWDRVQQAWYVPDSVDGAVLSKWLKAGTKGGSSTSNGEIEADLPAMAKIPSAPRDYLAVPYGDKEAAKAAGAAWDKVAKSWYIGPDGDREKLKRWSVETAGVVQEPAMSPKEEFANKMRDLGLVVEGDHPLMDGKKHRVPVEGGKKGAVDGFYVFYGDGLPAGRIINNLTGADEKWSSKGYSLSPEARAAMHAEAAANLARRAATQAAEHEEAAKRALHILSGLTPVDQLTPYLASKGLKAHHGAFTDSEGKTTYIPLIDAENKVWSMQFIQEDGKKRYAKNSRKESCFHAIGGMEALERAPALVIGEGYATAATLSEVLGHATVAAFDSGNLTAVAKALQAKFPDKPIVIAGDDDMPLVMTHGMNPGRTKAEEAAKAVGGVQVLPIFAPGEAMYPPGLELITPEKDRLGQLSDEQRAALSHMKRFTDWNDVATRSSLGNEGVARQVRPVVLAAIEAKALELERSRKKTIAADGPAGEEQITRPRRMARA